MAIGAKLKQARLEAGLSQRQLCGDMITRNMLSQIENGTARPSVDTLQYLARQLGKPVSWFLEEDAAVSSNRKVMDAAREAFGMQNAGQTLEILKEYRRPDACFDAEAALLQAEASLDAAQTALEEGRKPYALQLLEDARVFGAQTPYYRQAQERRRLLLLAQAQADGTTMLPSADPELMIRAQVALEQKDFAYAAALLDAVQDRQTAQWYYLRGVAAQSVGAYEQAVAWLRQAEAALPGQVNPCLECCYRQLGDYQKAYEYACKQRERE